MNAGPLRHLSAARLFLALLCLAPAVARAQSPGDPPPRTDPPTPEEAPRPGDVAEEPRAEDPLAAAAAAFAEARARFDAREYEAALTSFRRAYQLAPHDRVRFNIAVCLEELGRYRAAAVEYQAVAASAQLDDAIRARARAAHAAARAHLATLVLRAARPTQVAVDGEAGCATPCELSLDPGQHSLRYETSDGEARRRVRVVAGGRVEVALDTPSAPTAPTDDDTEPPAPGFEVDLGPLGGVGIVTAAAGIGGVIGFGLRAADLHAEYERLGCATVDCAEGELFRDATNVSIAVALAGALLIVVDLAFVDD